MKDADGGIPGDSSAVALLSSLSGVWPWTLDAEGGALHMAPAAASLLGLEVPPETQAGLVAALGAGAGPRLGAALADCLAGGAPVDLRVTGAGGHPVRILAVREAREGGVWRLRGLLQPLLRAGRGAPLEDFAADLPQVLFTADAGGRLDYISRPFVSPATGAPFRGPCERWTEIVHPEDRERAEAWRQAALAAGAARDTEVRLWVASEGAFRWHRMGLRPRHDAAGRAAAWVGYAADIHEIRAAQQETQRLADRLRVALDAARMGVWERPLDGESYELDERAAEISGIASGDVWHRDVLKASMHPEDLPGFLAAVEAADGSGRDLTLEYRLPRPEGGWRHIRSHSTVVTDPDGRRRVVGVVKDVSEEKRVLDELEARRREAEAATAAKSHFLAVMSHEIRTPLNGVLGMTALLATTRLSPEQRDMLSVVRNSGEMLMRVLNDILDFSKIESGRLDLETVPFAPADAILQCSALHRPQAEAKGIGFYVRFEGDARAPRLGDPYRFAQILNNLVGNAVKFTHSGEVTIAIRCEARGPVVIEVSDTGIGMSEAELRRVFEPFAQADPSTARRYGGTGLGLAITRRLVEVMSGRIEAVSRAGEGTRMRVILPLAPTPPGARTPGPDGEMSRLAPPATGEDA